MARPAGSRPPVPDRRAGSPRPGAVRPARSPPTAAAPPTGRPRTRVAPPAGRPRTRVAGPVERRRTRDPAPAPAPVAGRPAAGPAGCGVPVGPGTPAVRDRRQGRAEGRVRAAGGRPGGNEDPRVPGRRLVGPVHRPPVVGRVRPDRGVTVTSAVHPVSRVGGPWSGVTPAGVGSRPVGGGAPAHRRVGATRELPATGAHRGRHRPEHRDRAVPRDRAAADHGAAVDHRAAVDRERRRTGTGAPQPDRPARPDRVAG